MKIINDKEIELVAELKEMAQKTASREPFVDDSKELRTILRMLTHSVEMVTAQLQYEHDMSEAEGVTLPFERQVEVALDGDFARVYLNDADITDILPGDALSHLEREAEESIQERHDMKRARMTGGYHGIS